MNSGFANPLRVSVAASALLVLTNCTQPLDLDLRDIGNSKLDTTAAAQNINTNRPKPDSLGVIRYETYSVALARGGDTLKTLADRIGVPAAELARHNGMSVDMALRNGEIISIPGGAQLSQPTASTAATTSVTATTLPGTTPPEETSATPSSGATGEMVWQAGGDPIRHTVARGETAYTIARLYKVPVRGIAELNNLSADLNVRPGQIVLVPQLNATTVTEPVVTQPGTGSPTPTPPSATQPLPEEETVSTVEASTAPAPEQAPVLEQSASSSSSTQFSRPVDGPIIRAYAPGRNEGIDIGAAAGTPVKAAASGTVAAITKDTNGISIVVVRHSGGLLTVYTNIDNLTVQKGSAVSKGQTIGKVKAGDPSFVHFEVRNGLESVDPGDYL